MAKVNINFDKFFAESSKEKYLNSKVQQDRIDAKILEFLTGRYSEKVTVLVGDNQKLSLKNFMNQMKIHIEDEIWAEHENRLKKSKNKTASNGSSKSN